MEYITQAVGQLLRLLNGIRTFRRLGLLVAAVVAVMALASLTTVFWVNRTAVVPYVTLTKPKVLPIVLSERTQEAARALVRTTPKVVMLQVVRTSFENNTRQGIWAFSSDPQLDSDFSHYLQTRVSQTPLFVPGDHTANDRVIRIINQEFVCVPTLDRVKRIVPTIKQVKAICSIALPPQDGAMIGWVSLFVREDLSFSEQVQYKTILREFADALFRAEAT